MSVLLFLPFAGVGHAQLVFGNRIKLSDPISRIEFSKTVDMDGDGDIDIFTATDYGLQVNWWENDGQGNFTRHNWRPQNLLKQEVFGIADWNGDGRQDLWLEDHKDDPVVFDKTTVTYRIALGEPGGGFGVPSIVAHVPNHDGSYMEPLLADLDGNGSQDILGRGAIFMAGDNGTYLPPVSLPPQSRWNEREEVIFADYDRDGDLDILHKSNGSGDIRLSENLGEGSFSGAAVILDLEAYESCFGITFLTPDEQSGHPQLFLIIEDIQANTQRLATYTWESDGGFVEVARMRLPSREDEAYVTWHDIQTDDESARVFITSLTTMPSSQTFETELFEVDFRAEGLAIKSCSKHENVALIKSAAVRDLNADGNVDLVLPVASVPGTSGTTADHVVWLEGDASGVFSDTANVVIPPHNERNLLSLTDLDGDGDADILLGNGLPLDGSSEAGGISVWMNRGDEIGFDKQVIQAGCIRATVIAIDDFSDDNTPNHTPSPDITFPLESGRQNLLIESTHLNSFNGIIYRLFSIAYQDSDERFVTVPIQSLPTDSILSYEDWDDDGMKDLIFRDFTGNISWMKRIHGRFAHPQTIMTLPSSDLHDSGTFGFVDMDMDGDLDVFAKGNLFGPATSYWAERGEDTILSIRLLPQGIRLLDFDADGDGGVEFTNDAGIILKLGPGVTFAPTPYSFPNQSDRLFDMDGDEDLDSVISAPTYGTSGFQRLFWSENDGSNTRQGFGAELPIDPDVEFAQRNQFALGDMDGNGTKDLLVVSSDTALVEWFKITNQTGPAAFAGWMAAQDLSGSSAGPHGDWDKDGRSNWEEFLFGTAAKIHDSGVGAVPRMENIGQGLEFVFTRRKSGGGLSLFYPMQRSMTLNNDWEPWVPAIQGLTDLGDYEEVRIPATPSQNAEFFRIQLPEIPE